MGRYSCRRAQRLFKRVFILLSERRERHNEDAGFRLR
jgi:hypothetical protein